MREDYMSTFVERETNIATTAEKLNQLHDEILDSLQDKENNHELLEE